MAGEASEKIFGTINEKYHVVTYGEISTVVFILFILPASIFGVRYVIQSLYNIIKLGYKSCFKKSYEDTNEDTYLDDKYIEEKKPVHVCDHEN